ncbi:hypothetical protein DF947_10715 [Pedobacter paludis]|uniref:Uncharacterized protein n=1 Tax=Pedobacter paludis TaxID=2203212 RepID=A0A317F0J3_9SPHI|nr:hypothetical protein DF947_10715 [Pedobacter paludis]
MTILKDLSWNLAILTCLGLAEREDFMTGLPDFVLSQPNLKVSRVLLEMVANRFIAEEIAAIPEARYPRFVRLTAAASGKSLASSIK